jgi:hypothetical protein
MDFGFKSPLVDFFKRGDVAKDVRLMAARGAIAPRAHEQVALLALLTEDGDPEVKRAAEMTIASIPTASLAAFLGRADVSEGLREFFRARGIEPAPDSTSNDDPLVDAEPESTETGEAEQSDDKRVSVTQRLALLTVADRIKVAMKGSKDERAVLIRDPNKLVSVSVLSSPKVTESEVESFAKMLNVSEEVLRLIGMNRAWIKNYGVIAALSKNPKTPVAVTMHFVQRLTERDLKAITLDRNIQEPLKLAARKRLTAGVKK